MYSMLAHLPAPGQTSRQTGLPGPLLLLPAHPAPVLAGFWGQTNHLLPATQDKQE